MRLPRFLRPSNDRARIAAEVDAELATHLDLRAAELEQTGMSPAEARREALREFGDLDYTRRYCADMDRVSERRGNLGRRLATLRSDFRQALRTVRRHPGFAAVSIATLALAIGANTAVFSVADGLLLTPPPYGRPGELVALYENNLPRGNPRADMSAADIVDYRASQRTLEGIAVFGYGEGVLRDGPGDPVAVTALRVSANMFQILAVPPILGRTFAVGEDAAGAARVMVLSWALWKGRFGGDPTVVGRTVSLNGTPWQVIGVMPRGFMLRNQEQLWVPLDMSPILADVNRARKMHWMYGIARRRPGASLLETRADLMGIAHRLEAAYPDANQGHTITVEPLADALVKADLRRTTLLLSVAAGLVLLIACANVANMALSRAMNRRRELAVRAAIGASRGQLVRQLLLESVVLAVLGGLAGVGLAITGTRAVLAIHPGVLPGFVQIGLDARVLGFTLLVSVGAGVLFGVAPALYGSGAGLHGAAQQSGRGSAGERGRERFRGGLVVVQVAVAVVLLVCAGLLTRSMDRVRRVDAGFDPARLLTAEVNLRGPQYRSTAALNAFYDGVFSRVAASPGVVALGATSGLPLVGSSGCGLSREVDPFAAGTYPEVRCMSARGDYFKAIGVPLLKGRLFDATDQPDGAQVIVINETMARQFWTGGDPVGKRIRLGPDPSAPWETIVGVVGDVRQESLEGAPDATAFEYDAQHGWGGLALVIRTSGDPMAAVPALRAAVRAVDPALALADVRSMEDILGRSLAPRRFSQVVFGSFGILALLLAGIGIYGVIAYGVSSRTREFGIRTALGATVPGLVGGVLARGLAWSGAGLVLGGVAAVAAARSVRAMLYGVGPADGLTFAAVLSVLLGVAVLACLVPASRVARVDPVAALREE